jgi:hypothetical protein
LPNPRTGSNKQLEIGGTVGVLLPGVAVGWTVPVVVGVPVLLRVAVAEGVAVALGTCVGWLVAVGGTAVLLGAAVFVAEDEGWA